MPAVCEECRVLWRDYAAATSAHVELENKLRAAALEHDDSMIRLLTKKTEAAEKVRHDLRERIRQHEESHSADAANA